MIVLTIVVWAVMFVFFVVGWVGHNVEPFRELFAISRTTIDVCTICWGVGAILLFVVGPVFFPLPLPFPGLVNWIVTSTMGLLATGWVGGILTKHMVEFGTQRHAEVQSQFLTKQARLSDTSEPPVVGA